MLKTLKWDFKKSISHLRKFSPVLKPFFTGTVLFYVFLIAKHATNMIELLFVNYKLNICVCI